MQRLRSIIKSTVYSFRLAFRSSKLMVLLYFALTLICATFPLFSAFVLKYLLDNLAAESLDMTAVVLCTAMYVASLVAVQFMNSLQQIVYTFVFTKAKHLYDCDLAEKLVDLPMAVIDTSEGKDLIDYVRFAKNPIVFRPYRVVQVVSLLYTFSIAFAI